MITYVLRALLVVPLRCNNDLVVVSGSQTLLFIGSMFSIAECVAAPHLQRLRLLPSPSIRPQMAAALLSRLPPEARTGDSSDPLLQFMQVKYPRLFEWANTVLSRDSVVSTFPSESITSVISKVTSEWTE